MEVISPHFSFELKVKNWWRWDIVGKVLEEIGKRGQTSKYKKIDIYFDKGEIYVFPISKKDLKVNFYGKSDETNCKWKPNEKSKVHKR